MMTRAMALDHAGDGLRINAICPGGVDTPMLAGYEQRSKTKKLTIASFRLNWLTGSPNGRIASPEDIASARHVPRQRRGASHHRHGNPDRRRIDGVICGERLQSRLKSLPQVWSCAGKIYVGKYQRWRQRR